MSSERLERLGLPARAPEWLVLLAVFLVGVAIVMSRKPDAFTNAQFYIEDGREWYAQAHDLGPLRALAIPHRGYLVLVQRLGATLAVAFRIAWAPLVMALFGAAVDALPAVFLASSRFAALVPSRAMRLLLGLLCLAAPNAWTLMANATNSMWYLAVLACLVVLASPPTRRAWRVFDLAAVIVSGLSGPFSILLAPVAALKWGLRRERWSLALFAAAAATALVQAASILLDPGEREGKLALGAGVEKLANLFVRRVIYEALFGQVGGLKIYNGEWGDVWATRAVIGVVALLGIAVIVFVMWKAPLELRLFVVFAALTFLAAIAWPGGTPVGAVWWDLLMAAGNGGRYFFVPVLAFLFSCVWMASTRPVAIRAAAGVLLAVAAVGIALDWREPSYPNFDFPAAVRRYNATPPGEQFAILTPPDWTMSITKKAEEGIVVDPDECVGGAQVRTTVLASNQIAWQGNVGRAEGGDPYVILGLPSHRYVCGVRVTFVLTTASGEPAIFQSFWAASADDDFAGGGRDSSALVTSSPKPQSIVLHVHDTIDRVRFDPGTMPGTTFEVKQVVLLGEPIGGR